MHIAASNHAAAQADIAVVQHSRLTGCHRPLGLAKPQLTTCVATGHQIAGRETVVSGDVHIETVSATFDAQRVGCLYDQRVAEHVDTRADLYSLGITGFHMLTGKLPFDGKSPMEVIMKHVLDERVHVHELEPAIPKDLSEIVFKLMQKRPEHRFQSAAELVKALEYMNVSEGLMSTF